MQLRAPVWAIIVQPPTGDDVVFTSKTKRDALSWMRASSAEERKYMKLLTPDEIKQTRGWVGDQASNTGMRSMVWHHKDYPGVSISRVFVGGRGLRRYQVNGTPDDSTPRFGTILEAKHHIAETWRIK